MKKTTILLVIGLLLLMAAAPVIKLMRLEVVNKSDFDAYLKLQEVEYENAQQYYLHILPGSDQLPGVRVFTLVRGVYNLSANYCDLEDVTYFELLDLTGSRFRLVIPPCAESNAVTGDGVLKLNPQLWPPVDLVTGAPIIYEFRFRY